MNLPLTPFEHIIKKAGAKRVSVAAVEELRDIVEDYGLKLSRKAWNVAQHSSRRTVQKKDIKFVVQH